MAKLKEPKEGTAKTIANLRKEVAKLKAELKRAKKDARSNLPFWRM